MSEPNRVTAGDQWADLRAVEDLTWADQEDWDERATAFRLEISEMLIDPETGQRRMAVSADGVTQEPAPLPPEARTANLRLLASRRDALLASLITAWSYEALELPFRPEYREKIGLPMGKALSRALLPYFETLQDDGPKESPDPARPPRSSGSASSSRARPRTSRKG